MLWELSETFSGLKESLGHIFFMNDQSKCVNDCFPGLGVEPSYDGQNLNSPSSGSRANYIGCAGHYYTANVVCLRRE